MTRKAKWSEEDVKSKTIFPFLLKLGFKPSEIQCEKHVEVRFGRNLFRAGSGKATDRATGRIDFVVNLPDEPNLILIEAKRDDGPITPDDIDQGLSYAKAVEPFPPVTMITNGREWRIFNSRTREEIAEKEVDGYQVDLDDAARYYKAIRRLRTLSRHNLKGFCDWHVREHMAPLLGSKSELAKKYIPELFHEPFEIAEQFEAFLESDRMVFVVTGRSGDGKSCWMCHTAQRLQSDGWGVFFFRGLDVRRGIARTIADEIQSQIGPEYSPIEAMRRVREVTNRSVVFVDGLDEISQSDARDITADFLRQSATNKLRLVVSCKSVRFPEICEVDQVPTVLGERTEEQGLRCRLPLEWSPPDFNAIVNRHREVYRNSARFGKRALEESKRSPFILRILFEEAEGKDESWVMTIDSQNVYDTMLSNARSRLRGKVPNFEEFLTIIANEMLQNDTDSISEADARSALGLRITEELPPLLFETSVLERDFLQDGTINIRFYFGRMRDFFIAFRVLRWHRMTRDEIRDSVSSLPRSTVSSDALELFYTLAPQSTRRILDNDLYQYGVAFLAAFSEKLNGDFGGLKDRLIYGHQDDRDLGFVGEIVLAPLFLRMEGVQAVEPGSPKVVLIPSGSDGVHGHHAGMMRGGGNVGKNPRQSASSTLWSGIKGLIEKFDLDESVCPVLLKERILAFHAEPYTSVLENIPTTVSASRWKVLYDKALRYRRNELYARLEESGNCEVTWNGTSKSVSYGAVSLPDQEAIIDFAVEAANSGQVVEAKEFRSAIRVESTILSYLDILEDQGHHDLLDEPLLQWYARPFASRSHADEAAIVRWIADNLVSTYEAFVKRNFPNHWQLFPFVATPKRIVMYWGGEEESLEQWSFRASQPRTSFQVVDDKAGLPTEYPFPDDVVGFSRSRNALPISYRASRLGDPFNYNMFLFHKLIYDQVWDDLKETVPEFAEQCRMGKQTDSWM